MNEEQLDNSLTKKSWCRDFIEKILQKSGEAIYRHKDQKSSFQRNAEDVCMKNQSRSIRENCGQMYKESVIPPQSSKNLCALPSLHQWFT